MAKRDHDLRIAFQRFGLGLKPGQAAQLAGDPRAACLADIDSARAVLKDETLPSTARGIQIVTEIEERRREMRQAQRQVAQAQARNEAGVMPQSAGSVTPAMPDPDEVRLADVLAAEVKARFAHGLQTEIGFAERWVHFWSNHFCIALRRGNILRGIAGSYEREAIRPHVFGRFEDLLIAVETHPAMLHYLDQRQSIGPNSPAGIRQKRGLNENLAREILELHTLGVKGGYSQADVTSFARILTGWSITGRDENLDGFGGFHFAANRHEPGPHPVLGKVYPNPGKERGLAVLRDLARHPATATFVAEKLARHFVADDPPAVLVQKLSETFRRSEGDLASLARTLLTHDEAWRPASQKLRTPSEFLLAVYRAGGIAPERPQAVLNMLNLMGQPIWNPIGPNGHADDVASVAAPKAIKTRLDFSLQIARAFAGFRDPRELAADLYGETLSTETRQAIARAETRPQGLAILFMSPEFQRR